MLIIKRYTVSVKSNSDNEFHFFINGSEAVPVEFEVGKQGFFVYKFGENPDEWHRVVTSVVNDVREEDKSIIVETQNSTYKFEEN